MLKIIAQTERQNRVEVVNNKVDLKEKEEIIGKKNYKNKLIMVKQNNLINQNKIELRSKHSHGIGREHGAEVDAFVMTRKVNNPEMIWN